MSRKRQTYYRPGTRVKITADVGILNDDDSSVESVELRGEEAEVSAVNANYTNQETGEPMVGLTLGNGAIIAAPTRALRKLEPVGLVRGSRRAFAAGWHTLFGR